MSHTHITITLSYSNDETIHLDLRIPLKIRVQHLIMELNDLFEKKVNQKKYQLTVLNKGLILGEGCWLKDYPLGDGDRLEVLENDGYGRYD